MKKLILILTALFCFLSFSAPAWCWDEGGWDGQRVPFIRTTSAPAVTDDDFPVPYVWINESTNKAYLLTDNTPGAAVWQEVIYTGGSPSFVTVDLTGVTDGNIPYMQAAGAGLGDSPISRTDADTVTIQSTTGKAVTLNLTADAGEDNSDKYRVSVADGGDVTLETYASGAWVAVATWTSAGGYTVTGALAGTTLNTGQGANELYDMDQNMLTTSDVTHNAITANSNVSAKTYTATPNTTTAVPTAYLDDASIACTYSLMRVAGSGGAVTLDTEPAIADGTYDGQMLTIQGCHDTNTVTIADACNTALTGGASFTLGLGDIIVLQWDAGQSIWWEHYRSNN